MNKTTQIALLATVALSAVTQATMAGAQTAPPVLSAAPAEPSDSGDILVTARRRAERLQDVPIAITAFDGEKLAKANITKTDDLMQQTPGLTVQPSSFGKSAIAFGIRSQRQYLAYMTVDQSVGVYQDEVYQSRTNGLNSMLFDLDSVQVLKGPQGTLFGRNTPGGAILFASKLPGHEFEGYGRVATGNYGLYRGEAGLTVPLGKAFSVRVAGAFNVHKGYTPNLFNGVRLDDEDAKAYRVSLRYDDDGPLRNTLIVGGMRERDNGQGYKALKIDPAFEAYYRANNIRVAILNITSPVIAQLATKDFHTVNINQPVPGIRVNTVSLSNTTEFDVTDNVLGKNIFGYRKVRAENYFDFDGTPTSTFVSFESQRSRQYSDELQLQASMFDRTVDLLIGGFFFDEKGDNRQISNNRASGGLIQNRSYAGFAQATWRTPFLRGLSLTAGGRLTRDERFYDAQNFAATNPPSQVCRIPVSDLAPTVVISPCSLKNKVNFTEPTYTFSADYRIIPEALAYVTYRRGYRSGGFTFAGTRRAEFTPYRPETVNDIEIGLKTNFEVVGGPAHLNIAAYRDKYNDIQRTVSEVRSEGSGANTTSFPVTLTKNAASATIKGFEIEGGWKPVTGLELTGFWNYSKPRYDKFQITTSTGAVLDYSNNPFSFAPRNTFGAAVNVEVPIDAEAGNFSLRLDMYHQDVVFAQDVVFDPAQPTATLRATALGVLPAYTVYNARIGWSDIFRKGIDLGVFVKNLTDKDYFVGGVDLTTSLSTNVGMMGSPRTYGLEVSYRF